MWDIFSRTLRLTPAYIDKQMLLLVCHELDFILQVGLTKYNGTYCHISLQFVLQLLATASKCNHFVELKLGSYIKSLMLKTFQAAHCTMIIS